MTTMPSTVNLNESAEKNGLQIFLARGTAVDMASGGLRSSWYVEVFETRYATSGRLLKPQLLMRVIASDEQTPLDLLEMLKLAWEQGDVEISR